LGGFCADSGLKVLLIDMDPVQPSLSSYYPMAEEVTEAGLPQDACVTLSTKIGRGQKVSTSINGGTAVNGEVSSAAATTGCSTDSNTVAWTAY
ncbi:type 4 pilus major pilin, partial [Pseudomonas viridiflava]|uniref:type 4 pilus major pilin n=1 Tax=Pseudomonas viridiflava TaxID=33069 RepID=UPI0023F7C441